MSFCRVTAGHVTGVDRLARIQAMVREGTARCRSRQGWRWTGGGTRASGGVAAKNLKIVPQARNGRRNGAKFLRIPRKRGFCIQYLYN
jgi:hypothetical protein